MAKGPGNQGIAGGQYGTGRMGTQGDLRKIRAELETGAELKTRAEPVELDSRVELETRAKLKTRAEPVELETREELKTRAEPVELKTREKPVELETKVKQGTRVELKTRAEQGARMELETRAKQGTRVELKTRVEGDTGVNSQTSPIPLSQKLISSRPNPTKKLGENPVPSTPGRMTPIPSHSRVVVFFFFRNLSVTVKI